MGVSNIIMSNLFEYVRKRKKNIIVMFLFPFIFIFLNRFIYGDDIKKSEEELQVCIPTFCVYGSATPLNEVLVAAARIPERAVASHTFFLTKDMSAKEVKQYYTEQLLKSGWKESGYQLEIDNRDDLCTADYFYFQKGEHIFLLRFAPPLERKEKIKIYYEAPQYSIHFAKKEVLDRKVKIKL